MMPAARVREAIWDGADSPRRWADRVIKPQLIGLLEFLKPVGWVLALSPLFLALFNGLPFALGNNATLALALAGSFAVHFSSRPSRQELLATAAIAGALRTLYPWFVGPIANYPASAWISWGSFLGIASLLVLGARLLSRRGLALKTASRNFWASNAFLYSWIIGVFALQLTPHTLPETMDRFLYAFDGSLGFEPSFAAGRILAASPLLQLLTAMQYQSLMLCVAIVYAWQRMRPASLSTKILPVSVSMMITGYLLYHLYAAAGPGYGFGPLFPYKPPEVLHLALTPMPLHSAPRNAMPSLHMGMALLVWWHTRGSHWLGRLLAGLFLLATAFSTLATGEHYFIDLVVAFPFAMAIQTAWVGTVPITAPARYLSVLAGALMTFSWLLLLRFGVHWMFLSPLLPWLLVGFTVAYSLCTERNLSVRCALSQTRSLASSTA